MTYTLADAIREQFERDHPRGKNALFCEQCRRTKDRNDFRETPWHGRAARCQSCEGFRWGDVVHERTLWELEQAREKLRMYQRIAAIRRYAYVPRRYVMAWPADVRYTLPEIRPKRRRRVTLERRTHG